LVVCLLLLLRLLHQKEPAATLGWLTQLHGATLQAPNCCW
jgi:hypothetical protein